MNGLCEFVGILLMVGVCAWLVSAIHKERQ